MVSAIEESRGAPAPGGLRPAAVAGGALAILAGLIVLNLVAIVLTDGGTGPGQRVAQLFFLDRESNLPTFFNYALLIGISALLALLAVRAYDEGSAWRRHWAGLTVIFLLLAYDEASSLHERLVPIIRQAAHTEGLLYYGWIIPGAAFALVVGLVYLRFVLALPRAVAALTIVGGALYITGTLGVEAITDLQALKTGALFVWAAESGAILGRSDPEPLRRYGAALGLAFQIGDDVLDVRGDAEAAGKRLRKDEAKGKATFVSLLGLEGAEAKARDLVEAACDTLAPYGSAAGNLRLAARFALERGR